MSRKTVFSDLRESNAFLNILLDNINSAVLVMDQNAGIHGINDFFVNLFGDHGLGGPALTFGQAAGCAFSVAENQGCGHTSHCGRCALQKTLARTLTRKVPAEKVPLSREFLISGRLLMKHLEFTTRHIRFQGREMVLVIIYDVTELTEKKTQLARKQELLDRDLEGAALIQKSLLPPKGMKASALGIAWEFAPSTQIGGDIFNVLTMAGGRTALYMVDVCGHGVSAALVSVAVSQHLGNMLHHDYANKAPLEPETVLRDLEKHFPFERFDTFFTCLYVVVDEKRSMLHCASAGHPTPLLIRPGKAPEKISVKGPAIGLGQSPVFERTTRELYPGDRLLLYTDGLTEASSPDGGLYGKKRLLSVLDSCRESPAQTLARELLRDVRTFSGHRGLDDDVSILVADYAPGIT